MNNLTDFSARLVWLGWLLFPLHHQAPASWLTLRVPWLLECHIPIIHPSIQPTIATSQPLPWQTGEAGSAIPELGTGEVLTFLCLAGWVSGQSQLWSVDGASGQVVSLNNILKMPENWVIACSGTTQKWTYLHANGLFKLMEQFEYRLVPLHDLELLQTYCGFNTSLWSP